MASYAELLEVASYPPLMQRVKVACIIAAEAIRTEPAQTAGHDARMDWAGRVFENPQAEAERMIWACLAQNKDSTVTQIQAATDAQVQAVVNAAVSVFARSRST
jgi:hypothetical protein